MKRGVDWHYYCTPEITTISRVPHLTFARFIHGYLDTSISRVFVRQIFTIYTCFSWVFHVFLFTRNPHYFTCSTHHTFTCYSRGFRHVTFTNWHVFYTCISCVFVCRGRQTTVILFQYALGKWSMALSMIVTWVSCTCLMICQYYSLHNINIASIMFHSISNTLGSIINNHDKMYREQCMAVML